MEKTIARLLAHMKENQMNEFVKGRDTAHSIKDAMRDGIQLIQSDFEKRCIAELASECLDGDGEIELDDLLVEP